MIKILKSKSFKYIAFAFLGAMGYRFVYVNHGDKIKTFIGVTAAKSNRILHKNWKHDSLFLYANEKAQLQLEKRKQFAVKYRRGHRVIEPNSEKIKIKIKEGSELNDVKIWIKGGTGPHYSGNEFPSVNIKNGNEKYSIVRFHARNGFVDALCFELAGELGLINNVPDLKYVFYNDEYQGLYWCEYPIKNKLESLRLDGYLLDFDMDYMWSRNYLVHSDWTAYLEDVFNHAPITFKKIGNPNSELNSEKVTRDWIKDKISKTDIGNLFLLIDLTGFNHAIGLTNLDLFYDEKSDQIRLIPKDFQEIINGQPKEVFENRNFLFEAISRYKSTSIWPLFLGANTVVWESYFSSLKRIKTDDILKNLEEINRPLINTLGEYDKKSYWNNLCAKLAVNHDAIIKTMHQKPLLKFVNEGNKMIITNYTYLDLMLCTPTDTILLPPLFKNQVPSRIEIEGEGFENYSIINKIANITYPTLELIEVSKEVFK